MSNHVSLISSTTTNTIGNHRSTNLSSQCEQQLSNLSFTNYSQQQQQLILQHRRRQHQQKILTNTRIILRKQLQIYTDWANHYLQKRYEELDSDYGSSCDKEDEYNSRYQSVQPRRRFITSLANDLQDGILLASIVESVSETTLENVTKMPKTSNEMIENIELAIKFLSHLGVNVNEIQAKDIYEGNLKSILTLFFNVSRYKQSLKSSTGKASNDTSGYSSDSGIALIRPNHSESSHGIILNSATPSANMISRLPSSSSSTSTAFNSSRLPSTTTRIVTHQTQQQHNPQPQLSGNSQPQSSIPSGTSNRRITSSSSSKQTSTNNNTLGIHRSASPATQSTVTPNSFSIAQPSRFSAKQPTLRSSSQPQTSSSTGAASRPNSITSIPQIGSLATNVVTSPKSSAFATTQSRVNGTSSSISGPSTTRTIQSNVNNRTNESSLNNGSTLKSKQTQSSSINSGLRANTSGVGGGGSNTVKYRSSVNSESASSSTTSLASSSNGTSSKPYSTQLNSLKGSATRIGSLSSLKRTQPSTSGTSRSRPISTIVETNSSIPNRSSMIMATSSMNGTNLSNAASQLANTKPTATVKAMVTPIMSTSIKKRTEPKSKSVNHNDQTTSATVKLNKAMEELKKSKKNLDNNQDDGDETSSQSTEDPIGEPVESNANCDDDSGSSHSSSDIESALANIEPMQPINLERPSIHSFTYLKGQSQQSQINSNQQNRQYQTSTQLQSNKSNYCEDFSDNSESPNRIKSSRMTIPNYAYIGDDGNCSISNHLSNSNTLLNLHLRPNRSNSLRAKNAKSQSELGSICFDETSSLSSDPGMISGTDVSTGTTTTSSSIGSSSTDQRIVYGKKPAPNNGTIGASTIIGNRIRKNNGNDTKLTLYSQESIDSPNEPLKRQQPNLVLQRSNGSSSSRKNSLTSSNGDLSSSSTVTNNGGSMLVSAATKSSTNRPLSSPSSKNLSIHSGTLPLNGNKGRSGSLTSTSSSRYHTTANHHHLKNNNKLRSNSLATGHGSTEQVYSDSECVQQRSMMYRIASRTPYPMGTMMAPLLPPTCSSNSSSQNALYQSVRTKDGALMDASSSINGSDQSIYSNTIEVYNNNNGRSKPGLMSNNLNQPYYGRNAYTDTESIDSFQLGSSNCELQHANYQNFFPPPPPPQTASNHQTMPTHHHHQSKPGDLIYEYETLNRGIRETMSASPTMLMANSVNNGQLNRSGSLRSRTTTTINHNGQFEAPDGCPRPPIPIHHHNHKNGSQMSTTNVNTSTTTTVSTNSAMMMKQLDEQQLQQQQQSGSSLSLLSNVSCSMFTTPEEKYIHEIRKLRRELDQANEKIFTLTSQLTANAHMVAAFEQSLSSMTNRLQQLSSSSELKDCELDRLRKTIETLKQQGGSLVSGCRSFSSVRHGSMPGSYTNDGKSFQHHLSAESVNSVSSCGDVNSSSGKTKKKSKLKGITSQNANWIRSSFSRAFKKKSSNKNGCDGSNNRDVMSDVESGPELGRRYESIGQLASNTNDNSRSVPSSPLLSVRSFKTSTSSSSEPKTKSEIDPNSPESLVAHELQKQLREKDMELTDMRLDSLTNAHKMEALNDMLNQMRLEMVSLKQDNDRLQRLINHKSLASSASSLATNSNAAIGLNGQTEMGNNRQQQQQQQTLMERANSLESIDICDMIDSSNANTDTPKSVTLGSGSHCLASFGIGTKTNWDQLDTIVKRLFKEHLIRVDCNLSLGITVDSLACYRVGVEQIQRNFQLNSNFDSNVNVPELLPFGYLVEESHINLQFKSALDSLAFDTLTPKSILNHYLEQLSDGRRLILAGASGMGKTYLAHKLAEYLVIEKRMNQEIFNSSLTPGAIATFNVDHKNAKELRAYLSNIVEQCELLNEQQQSKSIEDGEMLSLHSPRSPMGLIALPIVIILDNLHHIDDSLVLDIFNDLYRMNHPQCPYIIGTLNQNVTSNQTISDMFCRFQFRFASFTVHSEPVKGFLSRYLRRKWLETDAKLGKSPCFVSSDQLMIGRIIDWIPKVSVYLNRFLENLFPQQNICIGPRLFTSCPIDLNGSHIWFADLWNESILPFIIEQVRDHLHRSRSNGSTPQQIYLRLKEKYSDPTEWIIETYPWNHSNSNCNTTLNMEYSDHLNRLRIEDILEKDMMDLIGINLTQNQSSSSRCASSASGKFSTKPPTIPTIANGGVNDIKSIDTVTDPFLGSLLKLKEATAAEINSSHEAISSSTATTIINN